MAMWRPERDINPVKDEPVDTEMRFFTSLLDSAGGRIADEHRIPQ